MRREGPKERVRLGGTHADAAVDHLESEHDLARAALAVEAIRDLKTESDLRIEALERENAALRASLDTLTERMTRIEAAAARVR